MTKYGQLCFFWRLAMVVLMLAPASWSVDDDNYIQSVQGEGDSSSSSSFQQEQNVKENAMPQVSLISPNSFPFFLSSHKNNYGNVNERELSSSLAYNFTWDCNFAFGGLLRCKFGLNLTDTTTEEMSEVTAMSSCGAVVDNFREATGCSCTATIKPRNSFAEHTCGCAACHDSRSPSYFSIDCTKEPLGRKIISDCAALDCDFACNGICTDDCPQPANDDPTCITCPRPTGAPSTAKPTRPPTPPPTKRPSTEKPTRMPSTSKPTEMPTVSLAPTVSTQPSMSPTASARPTVSSRPTNKPSLPTTSRPTRSPPQELSLGVLTVDLVPGFGGVDIEAITGSLAIYMRSELKKKFDNIMLFDLELLNEPNSKTLEYRARATFNTPVPSLDSLLEAQRIALENNWPAFLAFAPKEVTDVVGGGFSEGPAHRGQRVVAMDGDVRKY